VIAALVSNSGGFINEYTYQHGRTLLRLSHWLTPAQAQEYDQACVQVLGMLGA
jgi:hypothetical protein